MSVRALINELVEERRAELIGRADGRTPERAAGIGRRLFAVQPLPVALAGVALRRVPSADGPPPPAYGRTASAAAKCTAETASDPSPSPAGGPPARRATKSSENHFKLLFGWGWDTVNRPAALAAAVQVHGSDRARRRASVSASCSASINAGNSLTLAQTPFLVATY